MFTTALRTASVQKLLLVDGLGALLSALMLGLVLTTWERAFGMPSRTLVPLAVVAALFALYSLSGHFTNRGSAYLLGIAVANTVYCGVTLALVVAFRDALTWLGLAYFVGEILLILGLVLAEIRVARRELRGNLPASRPAR